MRGLALASALLLVACGPASPTDAGVPPRDAPRGPDAGFDPSALEACTPDLSAAFAGTGYASHTWLPSTPTARRLFYPLVVLAADGTANEPAGIIDARRAGVANATACAGEAGCVRAAIGFDADAARAAGLAVSTTLDATHLESVASELRASGVCALVTETADETFVASCIERTLFELSDGAGFLGEVPASDLDALVDEIAAAAPTASFFGPLTSLVERGLVLADRPEPVRYEPLDEENRAAIDALRTTDFSTFPFVAIVVPGQGPDDAETALNPVGRARADLGYDRWAANLAPVILVSGGHVHPDRTTYSEAIEMRRYLIETRGMPASAVLVDPYARHTTTNLRNATRILVRAGVPTNRPILITSDRVQSIYIASVPFATRCDEELYFRPFAELQVLSTFDSCMLPVEGSMHVAPSDPLDP